MKCEITGIKGDCPHPATVVIEESWVGETPEEVTPMYRCDGHGATEAGQAVIRMASGQVTRFTVSAVEDAEPTKYLANPAFRHVHYIATPQDEPECGDRTGSVSTNPLNVGCTVCISKLNSKTPVSE